MKGYMEYLESKLAPSTLKRYYNEYLLLKQFFMDQDALIYASYGDIIRYIELMRKKYDEPGTLTSILAAIKTFYSFLLKEGYIHKHPCKYLVLKDNKHKPIQFQDLFTIDELESLFEVKVRYKNLELRNKLILSLLIYQALTAGELIRLKIQDVNFNTGMIKINKTYRSNSRHLPLQNMQVLWMFKYVETDRPLLLKNESDYLLINGKGHADTIDSINSVVNGYKHLFEFKNLNPQTIRQSVIVNKLRIGEDIRKVQIFAGHKNISSTERYIPDDTENLIHQIGNFHPL